LFDDTPLIAEGHRRLVDAIEAREPQLAEERLRTHIVDTAEQVLDSLAHASPSEE
jgi:DNA-binding GntR family transcriptional regulator